jgi:dGTPase
VSPEIEQAMLDLRSYLFNTVYMNDKIKKNFDKAKKVIKELYEYFCENQDEFKIIYSRDSREGETHERAVCDFIASMTDSYAITLYERIFLPRRWQGDINAF